MLNDQNAREARGPLSDEGRWTAVLERDRLQDGRFYYAVQTTGIYCRPSCPAKRPKRDHVSFYDSPKAAERAGFRPCKRCKPDCDPADVSVKARISKACRLIEDADEPLSLNALAQAVGVSPHHFHRQFKAELGITPKAYAAAIRTMRAREALSRSKPVTEAIYEAGFGSSARFYASAHETLGMSPTTFRTGGTGEEIVYAVAPCTLGHVLVAASGTGICAILLGDAPEPLKAALLHQFPRAKILRGSSDFAATASSVVALVDNPAAPAGLPLDIIGTAFQRRVWEALQKIPAGTTATYSEIADRIGAPGAARAVAGACAANRLAVAIPCHRVVRADGSLSGYRWGKARKAALLEKEKKPS